jgi:hypothetical protein
VESPVDAETSLTLLLGRFVTPSGAIHGFLPRDWGLKCKDSFCLLYSSVPITNIVKHFKGFCSSYLRFLLNIIVTIIQYSRNVNNNLHLY